MCFRGGGIGHKETWEWNKVLFNDVGKLVDDEDANSETEEASGENPKGKEGQEEEAEAEEDEYPNLAVFVMRSFPALLQEIYSISMSRPRPKLN